MGFNPEIAILISVIFVLSILKMAKSDFKKMQKSIEKEEKKHNPPKNSEKIIEEEKATELEAKEQAAESTKTTDKREAKNELNLTHEEMEVIYRICSGACFIGVIFVMIHIISRVLSTGLTPLDGILSIAFFCLCSYGWNGWTKCTVKINEAKKN